MSQTLVALHSDPLFLLTHLWVGWGLADLGWALPGNFPSSCRSGWPRVLAANFPHISFAGVHSRTLKGLQLSKELALLPTFTEIWKSKWKCTMKLRTDKLPFQIYTIGQSKSWSSLSQGPGGYSASSGRDCNITSQRWKIQEGEELGPIILFMRKTKISTGEWMDDGEHS